MENYVREKKEMDGPGRPGERCPGANEPGRPGGGRGGRDNGLGNAGDTGVDRGCSPDGSDKDESIPGDAVNLGDLLKRKGGVPPNSKGCGTRTKPVSNRSLLASSSEMDPTEPNEPLTGSVPYVDVDAKEVPDVEAEAVMVDVEAEIESIVLGVDVEASGEPGVCESEPSVPYSGSPKTSRSVSSECTDPCRDPDLVKAASAAEYTDVAVDASE